MPYRSLERIRGWLDAHRHLFVAWPVDGITLDALPGACAPPTRAHHHGAASSPLGPGDLTCDPGGALIG